MNIQYSKQGNVPIFKNLILVVLILLSLSAGVAKVMKVPNEVEFFQGAGLSLGLLLALGFVQLIGGALLAFRRVRMLGAIVAALGFGISTVAIFLSGQAAFGVFSLLPVMMAAFVAKVERGRNGNAA